MAVRTRAALSPAAFVALAADLALGLGVLAALSLSRTGNALDDAPDWLPAVVAAFVLGALAVAISALVQATDPLARPEPRAPLRFRATIARRLPGRSDEGAGGGRPRRVRAGVPDRLAFVAAPGAALLVLGFVAPVLLEPLCNRFEPLAAATLERFSSPMRADGRRS